MDVEKFIECVRKYPVLYNKRHKDYKNAAKKDKIWEVIASEMNEKSDVLRTKWKGLKDGYTKYKKQMKGSVTSKIYKNWCWGPYLQFLDDFMKRRDSTSNSKPSQNSFTSLSEATLSPRSPHSKPSSPLRQSPQESETLQDNYDVIMLEQTPTIASPTPSLSSVGCRFLGYRTHKLESKNQTQAANEEDARLDKIINYLQNKHTQKPDAVDHLFMSYAETFKKFSVRTQTELKVEMAKLFADAELREHTIQSTVK